MRMRRNVAQRAARWWLLAHAGLLWTLTACAAPPWNGAARTDHPAAEAQLAHGLRHFERGEYDAAARELRRVPPLAPGYPRAQESLKRAEHILADAASAEQEALAHQANGDLLPARESLLRALQLYPKNPRSAASLARLNEEIETAAAHLTAEGHALYAQGRLDQAIEAFQRAHHMAPARPGLRDQLAAAYNARALMRYRDGLLSPAIDDLQRSLAINPQQDSIRGQLAELETRQRLLNDVTP